MIFGTNASQTFIPSIYSQRGIRHMSRS
jgi:hypothetical protein